MRPKNLSKFAVAAFICLLPFTLMAETAAELAAYINNYANYGVGSTGTLAAAASGNVVTVTGTVVTGTQSSANVLSLNIDAGVTVKWEASYTYGGQSSSNWFILLDGSGAFDVNNGTIALSVSASAILVNAVENPVALTVSGTGKVLNTTTGTSFYNHIQTTGSVLVKDNAEVSTTSGTTAIAATGANSTVTVEDNAVVTGNGQYVAIQASGANAFVTVKDNAYVRAINTAGSVLVEGSAEVSTTNGGTSAIQASGESSTVTVRGGTVSAACGTGSSSNVYAAINMSSASPTAANLVTVSGTAKVLNTGNQVNNYISAHAINTYGSVLVEGSAEVSATLAAPAIQARGASSTVTVRGGTVKNSGARATCPAIYMSDASNTGPNVTVSGTAKVLNDGNNAASYAIRTSGSVYVQDNAEVGAAGGTAILASGANSVIFVNAATATVSGASKYNNSGANAVIVEHIGTAGAAYIPDTDDDLTVTPSDATAVWAIDNETHGITYTRNTNTGFVEVSGVTLLREVSELMGFQGLGWDVTYSGSGQNSPSAFASIYGNNLGTNPEFVYAYTVGSDPAGTESFDEDGLPVNAGNYRVTVKYTDSKNGGFISREYTIAPKSISSATINVSGATTFTYTGAAQGPTAGDVTLTLAGFTPTYTVAAVDNINAGYGYLTITGTGNFSGTRGWYFTIEPKSISGAAVAVSGAYTYTGAAQTPTAENVSVTLAGFTPTYSIAAANNTNAGTATVTVTGTGNFSGTATGTFTIGKATYDMSGITFADKEVEYNGAAHSILIGGTLPYGVTAANYVAVSYDGNGKTAIGEYTVTATFFSNGPGDNYEIPAAITATLTITTPVSVLSQERIVPQSTPNEEATVIAPVAVLSGEFTAGPNPILKQSGIVNFYRQGKRVSNSELRIYDATGNVINKVKISDNVINNQSRRIVGKWDLTDRKGRQVSEGTYLVKGVLKTSDGKSEKVSVIVGVR